MRIWLDKTVDEEFADLGTQGHTGTLNDRQFTFLGTLSHTGSLADRMGSFIAGGRVVGDVTAPVLSGNSFNDTTDEATFSTTEGGTFVWATHLTTESVSANGSGGWTGVTLETGTDTVASSGESTISAAYTATTGTGGESRKFSYYVRDAAGNDSNVITETFTVNSTYSANAVDLQGAAYYGDATYLGPAATKVGTLHLSIYCPTSWPTAGSFFEFSTSGGTAALTLTFTSAGRAVLTGKDSGGAGNMLYKIIEPTGSFQGDTWYTLTISWDASVGTLLCYIGDTAYNGGFTADLTMYALGRCYVPDNANRNVWVSNYFAEAAFYDLTDTATRRQFVDANGKPVDISALGSPHLRLTGDYTAFGVNTGSADNLARTGTAPIAAASSPTD